MVVKKAKKPKKVRKIIVKAPEKKIKREKKFLKRGLKKEIALAKKASKAKKFFVKKRLHRSRVVSKQTLSKIIAGAFAKAQLDAEKRESSLREFFSKKTVSTAAVAPQAESDEELALRMLDVYFREVARRGLKRSLSLDEVINAYFYALMRMQRSSIELEEIKKIVNEKKF